MRNTGWPAGRLLAASSIVWWSQSFSVRTRLTAPIFLLLDDDVGPKSTFWFVHPDLLRFLQFVRIYISAVNFHELLISFQKNSWIIFDARADTAVGLLGRSRARAWQLVGHCRRRRPGRRRRGNVSPGFRGERPAAAEPSKSSAAVHRSRDRGRRVACPKMSRDPWACGSIDRVIPSIKIVHFIHGASVLYTLGRGTFLLLCFVCWFVYTQKMLASLLLLRASILPGSRASNASIVYAPNNFVVIQNPTRSCHGPMTLYSLQKKKKWWWHTSNSLKLIISTCAINYHRC
jgi:hypothetical protein